MMATDPIDIGGLLQAAGDTEWTGAPEGTVIGHLHLHVGDLSQASAFYSEAIGLDRTVWHYPGALFLAAGGYHHHLGTNTWAGSGALAPNPDDARLLEWIIELPDRESLAAVEKSLSQAGYLTAWEGRNLEEEVELVTQDPWGTQVRLALRSTTPGS
jgi:catechol 2,3-dioxygenase